MKELLRESHSAESIARGATDQKMKVTAGGNGNDARTVSTTNVKRQTMNKVY
jgi:hypothetical protein